VFLIINSEYVGSKNGFKEMPSALNDLHIIENFLKETIFKNACFVIKVINETKECLEEKWKEFESEIINDSS